MSDNTKTGGDEFWDDAENDKYVKIVAEKVPKKEDGGDGGGGKSVSWGDSNKDQNSSGGWGASNKDQTQNISWGDDNKGNTTNTKDEKKDKKGKVATTNTATSSSTKKGNDASSSSTKSAGPLRPSLPQLKKVSFAPTIVYTKKGKIINPTEYSPRVFMYEEEDEVAFVGGPAARRTSTPLIVMQPRGQGGSELNLSGICGGSGRGSPVSMASSTGTGRLIPVPIQVDAPRKSWGQRFQDCYTNICVCLDRCISCDSCDM